MVKIDKTKLERTLERAISNLEYAQENINQPGYVVRMVTADGELGGVLREVPGYGINFAGSPQTAKLFSGKAWAVRYMRQFNQHNTWLVQLVAEYHAAYINGAPDVIASLKECIASLD